MAKAVTNSLTKKRRRVSDIVLKSLIFLSSGIVVALTLGMIIYIAVKGTEGMSLNFLTTPAFSYPYENYGVLGNIINTLYLVVITLIIATPATEPAPQVTQVTTVAVTTAAVTATTAAAFFIHPQSSPFSSVRITGLLLQ